MPDRRRTGHTGDDGDIDYNRESASGIPRWVKVVGIVVAVVALLFIIMMLVGGTGGHGPGRHGASGPAGGTSLSVPADHPATVHVRFADGRDPVVAV